MTNYNARLDEILDGGIENIQDGVTLAIRAGQNIDYHTLDARVELKQSITSLIKELVAEAKPGNLPIFGSQNEAGDVSPSDYEAAGYNQAIKQFEQNLLKALEDGKRDLNIIDQFGHNLLKELEER